jgi:hypothetical protein
MGVRHSSWAVPAECEVLLRAAHRTAGTEDLARIDALTQGPFDWELCRALAGHHGMTPLVVRAMSRSSRRACPRGIWSHLLEAQRTIALENLSTTAELVAIVEDLDKKGVATLVVKGPVAGIALYGDVALRPFLDLDVLIAPAERDRTIERLAARGYRPVFDLDAAGWRRYFRRYTEMMCIHAGTGTTVDLHWALLDSRYRYSAALAGCWERAVSLPGRQRIRTLCPEDMLVHSLLHAAKHHWRLLRFLVDALLLIETHDDLDWQAISLALTRAPGCRRPMAVGFRLLELLFGWSLTRVAADWTAADARADDLAREAFRFLIRTDVPAPGLPWPWKQRFYRSLCARDRLRYTYETLLAPTPLEWMAAPLPEWLSGLYPAIRIARLAAKHGWHARWAA